MQKKITAWSETIPYESIEDLPAPMIAAIDFVYIISSTLRHNPMVYSSADNVLWIHYPNSCFICEEFFSSYGLYIALSKSSVYGGADSFEGGKLTARISDNGKALYCEKRNVSGTDFELIKDIALKIPLDNGKSVEEYKKLLCAVNYKSSCLVMERTSFTENVFDGQPQANPDTYFRYTFLSNTTEIYLNSLTIELIKKLWLLYLVDRLNPLEFNDAFSAMEKNQISIFPWELALRLALEETGITVNYGNGYSITDKNGRRITPSFDSNNFAERLFIKLIFPKNSIK